MTSLFKSVLLVFALLAGNAFAACNTTYNININAANPLSGTPFSACSMSGSTVTCSQDVTVSNNNACITTNAAPLVVNMSGKTFNWIGNSGELGTSANPIHLVMGTGNININGNSFTSYGDWSGKEIKCKTNPVTSINGTVTGTSVNTCNSYVHSTALAPSVTTLDATPASITSTSAIINGTVSSNGASTTVSFSYGLSSSYGITVTAAQSPLASSASSSAVSYLLTGLACGTTYHFRAAGSNSVGTVNGGDLTFSTLACFNVTKVASASSVALGGSVVYTITAVNPLGASSISNFSVIDNVPAGLSYSSCSAPTGGSCGTALGIPYMTTCSAGFGCSLLGGNTMTGSFTFVTTQAGTITNTATALSFFSTRDTASATITVTAASGADFDAYETSFTAPTVSAAKIKTHVASGSSICVSGGSCSLKVGAFTSGGRTLSNTMTGPVKLEIVDASSGACSTHAPVTTWVASQTLSATGETTVTLPAVANAYPNTRVRISYPATGTATSQSCSSDNFAIRPSSFTGVSVKDATSSTAGGANTLSNKTLTATTPIHKAGRPFSLSATAVNASGATTMNYIGTPNAELLSCTGGTACIDPIGRTLTVGAFSSGALASSTSTYDGIGSFSMRLQDTTFSAVDSSDGSTTAERYISSGALDVGRFVPDHFDTVMSSQGCVAFTYSGQPFSIKVYAKDASGATLTQYATTGGLANAVTLRDSNGVAGGFGTTTLTSTYSIPTFVDGVALSASSDLTPTFSFSSRTTAPSPINLRAVDSDGVDSSTGTTGLADSATEAATTIRSGRLQLSNAYGSELLALPMKVTAQYYDGSGWVISTQDCPTTPGGAVTISAVSGATACTGLSFLTPPAALVFGKGSFTLTKPTNGRCSADITLSLPSYLPSVSGRATFGIYKSPLIYRRENY